MKEDTKTRIEDAIQEKAEEVKERRRPSPTRRPAELLISARCDCDARVQK